MRRWWQYHLFSCSKKIHLAEERLFRFLCRIMILKDTGQKGSVYRENSAQGNRRQACAGGLL